ncbi:protein jag [Rummeliibacillus sp. TYF005]|uniref:RNA-binding cell elongation regulator Jag/EloR n=1 Tax=Rummeliibacillus sp. TYF005 TaxID=2058214 RepID=UPI000F54421A|nr:RNA-binding cell elongation regulator Jag/EloR [Rummeliibacillus sp. TYF005]RPJ94891.1 protein jag [Rummeliibacillus sp. TYF005]
MKQITQTGATVEEAILLALHELNLTRKQVDVEIIQEAKRGFLGIGSRKALIRVTEKQIEKPSTKQEDIEESEFVFRINSIQQDKEQDEIDTRISAISTLEKPTIDVVGPKDLQEEQEDTGMVDYSEAIEKVKEYITDIAIQLGIQDLTIQVEQKGKTINYRLSSEKAALLIGKRGQTLNALQQLTQLVAHQYIKRFILVKLDVENYRERRQKSLELLANRMADKAVHTGRKVELEPMPANERKIIHHVLANRVDVETYSKGEDIKRHLVIEPIR